MTKIGLLIPSTNRGMNFKTYDKTHFYRIFLNSFFRSRDTEYDFTIYLVADDDDPIYSIETERKKLRQSIESQKNITLAFVSSKGIEKGYVTAMWNRAFRVAYEDKCDYFYQIGDDVMIMDKGWERYFISELEKMGGIGMVAPFDYGRRLWEITNNRRQKFILTQSFVSRKHYEIFGFYFNPRIKNWFCDDWITNLYMRLGKAKYDEKFRIMNKGGAPRYTPPMGEQYKHVDKLCRVLVNLDIIKVTSFIQSKS